MQNWEYKNLEETCEFLDSKRKPITANKREPGPYPYYGATGILDYVKDYLFDEELILLGEDGAKWDAGDNSAFLISGKTWVNNHAHVLRPNSNVYSNWIIYFLNYSNLMKYVKGATVPKLNQENARSIEIPLPPLEEQKRIVKILDEKFAQLETVKANAKANLQNAKDLFQSQLTKAFSKNSWEKKRLGDALEKVIVPQRDKPKKFDGNIPWCRIEDRDGDLLNGTKSHQYVSDQTIKEMNLKVCPIGTILSASSGASIGSILINTVECCTNQTFIGLVCSNLLFNRYLYYFLKARIALLKSMGTGAALAYISQDKYKQMEIPLPPLPEQKRIVEELDSLSQKVRSLEEIYTKQLANCDELKQAFLAKAFAGEI